jgi:hypothetical protein
MRIGFIGISEFSNFPENLIKFPPKTLFKNGKFELETLPHNRKKTSLNPNT